MYSELCERLGLDHALFAFSHCRDVVAAVSNSGGMGVLGAGWMSADTLARNWTGSTGPWASVATASTWLSRNATKGWKSPTRKPWSNASGLRCRPLTWRSRIACCASTGFRNGRKTSRNRRRTCRAPLMPPHCPWWRRRCGHPKCRILVNALGTPPPEVIEAVQSSGRLIGALCGRVKQAVCARASRPGFRGRTRRGGRRSRGRDFQHRPLAAGGRCHRPVPRTRRPAASATAVRCWPPWRAAPPASGPGSIWVTVAEAAGEPAQKASYLKASSEDTVRSRSWTGKDRPRAQKRLDGGLGKGRFHRPPADATAVPGERRCAPPHRALCGHRRHPGGGDEPGRPGDSARSTKSNRAGSSCTGCFSEYAEALVHVSRLMPPDSRPD